MRIQRTFFWFKDGETEFLDLNKRFFSMGVLLNRLLNERYTGKKIQFINIDFATGKTYEIFPVLPKNESYYYGGHLRFYGVIDFDEFNNLGTEEQDQLIWNKACDYLLLSAQSTKNKQLAEASEYACKKGLEIRLKADYRMLEKDMVLFGQSFKTSIWVHFRKDGMYALFAVEKEGEIIYQKEIDHTENGVEFFLGMYADIELCDDTVVIKGRNEVNYLPLEITLSRDDLIKN